MFTLNLELSQLALIVENLRKDEQKTHTALNECLVINTNYNFDSNYSHQLSHETIKENISKLQIKLKIIRETIDQISILK